jgi:hypothetical protein
VRVVNGLIILAGVTALAACATSGSEPATIRAEPAKSAAPTPTEKVTIPYGYQTVMMNGEPMYCRNDVDTGSRVTHTRVCLSAAQLKASQDNSQDFMNSVQRNGAAASATGTPGMGH